MGNYFFDDLPVDDPDRVDGRAKVTGAAKYSAEYSLPGMVYGVLVGSTVARGTIKSIDSKAAERSPGVRAVITHLNSIKVPGYDAGANPAKGPVGGKSLQVFYDNIVRFYGQPVALVIADTLERARFASTLVKPSYVEEKHQTELNETRTTVPALEGTRYNDTTRGQADAWKTAEVKLEAEYIVPLEVHNPMELHATIAHWEAEDKVTVYDKTQGVKSSQRSIMQTFKLPEQNVQVYARFVGGGFGSALRTWPHVIAALIGAKQVGKPLKLVLSRDQMFTLVGFRPYTVQKMGLGASSDGKLTGISHEAYSHTSPYEEFTEGTVNISRLLYACPNVFTRYKVFPLNLSTPTWMRGPGEATGSFALESALDELAYKLGLDPVELRLRNYAETDPQNNRPYSSKFLKEAYQLGADRIGWKERNPKPGSMKEGEWQVGYGMGTGVFNVGRGTARALARIYADGKVLVQSAVADSGPGTATAMVQIAASALDLPASQISFELGDSSLPPGPTQGGSTTTSTLGSAVHDVCQSLKQKLASLAIAQQGGQLSGAAATDLVFEDGYIALASNRSKKISYADAVRLSGASHVEVTEESKGTEEMRKYSSYSYSVHFVKVLVHPVTGVVRVNRVVTVADSGKVISPKTAASQMIGGVVGGHWHGADGRRNY